jgi:uncharacterized coiled-coil DUF342 family protein
MPRRDRVAQWGDKWLFLAAFGIGSVGVLFLKALQVQQAVVTAWPVLVMAGYAGFVFATPRYRLREDRAGDTLYYLGFLFTMVSLGYSLWEFRAEDPTREIVSNFGIALATTIVGLALRITYQQLRQDPFEIERQTQLDLTQAASELRDHLVGAVRDFATLRDVITQTLTETSDNAKQASADAVREAAGACASGTKAMLSGVTSRIDEVTKVYAASAEQILKKTVAALTTGSEKYTTNAANLATLVEEATNSVRAHGAEMAEAAKKSAAAVAHLAKRIDALDIPEDLLRSRLQAIIDDLATAVTAVTEKSVGEQQRVVRLEAVVRGVLSTVEGVERRLTQLDEGLEAQRREVKDNLAELLRTISGLREAGSTAAEVVRSSAQGEARLVAELRGQLESDLSVVRKISKELQAQAAESATAVSQLHQSFASLTRAVVNAVSR